MSIKFLIDGSEVVVKATVDEWGFQIKAKFSEGF